MIWPGNSGSRLKILLKAVRSWDRQVLRKVVYPSRAVKGIATGLAAEGVRAKAHGLMVVRGTTKIPVSGSRITADR